MSRTLKDWLETEVQPFRGKSISWISQYHFFRDPIRPAYSDLSYFVSPADGIILYQQTVGPDDCIVRVKGRAYSRRDAVRARNYTAPSLVIGIVMEVVDAIVDRWRYPGTLS